MLTEFAPSEATFKAKIKNGRVVEITLRPFTLGDMAWMQKTFPTEKEQLDIANLKIEPIARMIWHQMDAESKQIFMRIKYQKEDDAGNIVDIEPEGYERLIEAMTGLDDFMAGFEALSYSRGVNGFQNTDIKKKTRKTKTQTLTNGLKSMIYSRILTA